MREPWQGTPGKLMKAVKSCLKPKITGKPETNSSNRQGFLNEKKNRVSFCTPKHPFSSDDGSRNSSQNVVQNGRQPRKEFHFSEQDHGSSIVYLHQSELLSLRACSYGCFQVCRVKKSARAKRENRLVKSGYVTQKGVFGSKFMGSPKKRSPKRSKKKRSKKR